MSQDFGKPSSLGGAIVPYRGRLPSFGADVFIADNARIIGDVEIDDASSVWFGAVLRGDINEIRIGKQTNIQDGTVIHVAHGGQGTYVGDRVTVGHMALLHACTIGNDVLIGMQACIMDGALVEPESMVAAGALITPGKIVKTGELWAGRPAKCIRKITIDEKMEIHDVAKRYCALAGEYQSA